MTVAHNPQSRGRQVSPLRTYLDATLVMVKVVSVIAVWLAIFLGMMFGYLMLPVIVLVGFLAVYGGLDLLSRRLRRGSH